MITPRFSLLRYNAVVRGWSWIGVSLLVLVAACGPPRPTTLEQLANKQVWLMVSFDPPAPQPPALMVTVPPVAPGLWTVAVGGVVHAAVVDCAGAVDCGSLIVREDRLDLTIE